MLLVQGRDGPGPGTARPPDPTLSMVAVQLGPRQPTCWWP